MAAVANVGSLQEWRKATGGAAFVVGDLEVASVHICDNGNARLMLASVLVNDDEFRLVVRGDFRDAPEELFAAIQYEKDIDRARLPPWTKSRWMVEWGYGFCPCGAVGIDLTTLCFAWACEIDLRFSLRELRESDFAASEPACRAVAWLITEVGGRSDNCMKVSTVLMRSFFSLDDKLFNLIMPAPVDIQPYVEWAADKPIRSVTIWDYWYTALRPLIQSGAVTAEDIRRDERINGRLAKENLSRYLAVRGYHFEEVVKAWSGGMEYSFEARKGVVKASAGEIVPPAARPHGWQPAKSVVGRKPRLNSD